MASIQGSINQLLGIAAAGISAGKHLKGQKDIAKSQEDVAEALKSKAAYEHQFEQAKLQHQIDIYDQISNDEELPSEETQERHWKAQRELNILNPTKEGIKKEAELYQIAFPTVQKDPKQKAWEALAKEQDRIRNSKIIRGGTTYGQRETYNV